MFEGPELLIIVIVVLVLFGGSQIPKLARSLGEARSEFKKGMTDAEAEDSGGGSAADTGPKNSSGETKNSNGN